MPLQKQNIVLGKQKQFGAAAIHSVSILVKLLGDLRGTHGRLIRTPVDSGAGERTLPLGGSERYSGPDPILNPKTILF